VFQVADIYEDAESISGVCDQSKNFRWIEDALQLVANKGLFDPYTGMVDICVDGRYVTLPREIDTPIAINIDGKPALGRDQLFQFHLNGPGTSDCPCSWSWDDQGLVCLYQELNAPSYLCARLQRESDSGTLLIVYGYDEQGRPIRQERDGAWQDGWQIPTIFGYPVRDADMPKFARVTRIRKAETDGTIDLMTIDFSGLTGSILGVYEPDETDPSYRRIKLNRRASWVRMTYRKTGPKIRSMYERIPLRSRLAFTLSLQAVKSYKEFDLPSAMQLEANAARLETEAQTASSPPTMMPLQVVDVGNNLNDQTDCVE
jgi:hypothetical protein